MFARKNLVLAAFAAVSAAAFAVPASAQNDDRYVYPVADSTYYESEITVTAPYRVRRSANGDEASVTRVVSARDLDLRYQAHADELYRRVVNTAKAACEDADDVLRGNSATTDRQCVRKAVNDAMPQYRAVVTRARY